jgi:hypothetical protein
MSIGGHQSAAMLKDEWLTPPHVLDALGKFDLDPCSPSPDRRPWPTATDHFDAWDDGMKQPWAGRVWCNPPYGLEAAQWLARCADHGNAMALIFARTETRMFFEHVWPKASGLLFLEGRLYFHHVDGSRAKANSGAPSVLIAYGDENAEVLRTCTLDGFFVDLRRSAAA